MRGIILIETILLVCITLNYILKCLEYKNLRDLFDNRGKSIKMLNEEVKREIYEAEEEIKRLKHRVYVLKKDTKRNQRAIVRYKERITKFKHICDVHYRRLADMRDELLTERNVARWYKNWYKVMENERSAYLYCLRQIQEEVTNAKEE